MKEVKTDDPIDVAELAVHDIDEASLANGLFELLWAQKALSSLVWDMSDPTNMQVAYATYAVIGELVELADKVGFKIWKDAPELTDASKADIADEFADVLAFLGQLMVILYNRTGLSPVDLAMAYHNKSHKNLKRFIGESGEAGYSGVANGNVR